MAKLIKQVETVQQYGFNFDNGEVETSTTLYNLYKNTAQATPVNGTGGSPSYLVKSLDTSNPLIGKGSLLITKSANNAQGEGLSLDFSIDRGQVTSTAQISFTYETSANYVDGDIGVYLYDKTNSTLLYPSIVNLPATYGKPSNHLITFIPSTSNSYRLIFHVQSTSALAYTFGLDNIEIGNKKVAIGAAISEWRTWTPLNQLVNLPGSWSSATSWRRVGSNFEAFLTYTISGAGTGTVTWDVDAELAALGLSRTSTATNIVGPAYFRDASSTSTNTCGIFRIASGTLYFTPSDKGYITATSPFTWASTDVLYFNFSIPISQWTSNVNLTSDFTEYGSNDGSGGTTANTSYTTGMKNGLEGSNIVAVDSTTTGTASQTSYKVTFKNPIQLTDKIFIETNTGSGWTDNIYTRIVNGTARYGLYYTPISGDAYSVNAVFGNAGAYPTGTTYGSAGTTWSSQTSYKWRVRKVSNGNMAEVPPTVRAECKVSTAADFNGRIDFDNKIEDTHNCVTTGVNWKFIAPISGVYLVSGLLGSATASAIYAILYKNGISVFNALRFTSGDGTTVAAHQVSNTIRLNVGDYIDLRTSANVNLSGISYIQITRIGS